MSQKIQSSLSSAPPAILVGTYRREQLEKWILPKGLYNYPISDADEIPDTRLSVVKELWLFNGTKGQMVFDAEFIGIRERSQLEDYPLGKGKPHANKYLLFRITTKYGSDLPAAPVIVRADDFAGRSPAIRRQIMAALSSSDASKRAIVAHRIPPSIAALPSDRLRVCETAGQLTFADLLRGTSVFPPPCETSTVLSSASTASTWSCHSETPAKRIAVASVAEMERLNFSENAFLIGDALTALRRLPDSLVQTIVTSPPYWSLRDYGVAGQIGVAEKLPAYIASLASVFDEARRVLRPDGILWLNIGDSYTSGNRKWRAPDKKNPARAMGIRPPTPEGLKDKELIGIPWRLALALQDSGWYLRSEIIWRKPNCQPESVQDRPTREHEQVFMFAKSERYRYDIESIRGENGRRLRTVWDINTRPNKYASGHFATFPRELVARCLQLTSREGDVVMDPFLGSGTTAVEALRTNRRILGIELNPAYVDIACNWVSHECDAELVHIGDARTWSETVKQ